MSYDARTVANYFLRKAEERELTISNLSVNKLIYFAHGLYFVEQNKGLIKNAFEAWQYGPVVRVVYDAFKKFGDAPIQEPAKRFNPVDGCWEELTENLNAADAFFLDSVYDMFQMCSAGQLVSMSHEPGSPWEKLWESDEPVVRAGMIIRDEEILAHFSGRNS